ncbi:sugar nucleotide-binding protein [Thiotrichales bacterium HSG1]|nr:sugar nucleotide-binding protein [Thiotrichales bacterium HSG1]
MPITTKDYPVPAQRPMYSVLSNDKLAKTFGIVLPNWSNGLNLCLTSSN